MRILVTGGAGFIGTNLIEHIHKNFSDYTIVSIDNYSTGSISNHVDNVSYISCDVENINEIDSPCMKKPFDIAFHLAALSRIQPSFVEPLQTFISNTYATQIFLEWARKHVNKVVYAGSSSKWHDYKISPYATYKYLGEELCKMYKNVFKMNIEICRFYNVYGPHEILEGEFSAVIGKWRYQALNNKPLTIVGNGEQKRDFTHVLDIVDGLLKVALTNKSHNDAWELGSGQNFSINELYQMFKDRYGENINYVYINDQQGNYKETLRKNDDTLLLLNWKINHDLKTYISNL